MRSKLEIIPLLIALLIAPQQAGAESPTAVDIKESINLTLENNASLLSLKQEIIKAAAFKVQADGTLLPSISASANIDKQMFHNPGGEPVIATRMRVQVFPQRSVTFRLRPEDMANLRQQPVRFSMPSQ